MLDGVSPDPIFAVLPRRVGSVAADELSASLQSKGLWTPVRIRGDVEDQGGYRLMLASRQPVARSGESAS